MSESSFYKEIFATVLDYSIDLYAYLDSNNRYQYVSKSYAHFYGFSVEELIGQSPELVFDKDTYKNVVMPNLNQCLKTSAPVNFESWILAEKAEEPCFLYTSYLPHISSETGEIRGVIVTSKDVSEFKRAENILSKSASTDALTGLPNRLYIENTLNKLSSSYQRTSDRFALLFLDLDGFKAVNDQYGHAVGDKVLYQAAKRLEKLIRAEDVIGRWGGDEFIMLISPLYDPESLPIVKEKITDCISQPFNISGHEVSIGVSVGVAIYPDETTNMNDLISHADKRMYYHKNKKRD